MKFLIVFVALFALALARPQSPRDAQTLRHDVNIEPYSWSYAVETSDGKKVEENAELENIGTDDEAAVVRGSYSYVGDDGQTYSVSYIADKNGFQPQGAHIPVA